jgi:hypothetical protein
MIGDFISEIRNQKSEMRQWEIAVVMAVVGRSEPGAPMPSCPEKD